MARLWKSIPPLYFLQGDFIIEEKESKTMIENTGIRAKVLQEITEIAERNGVDRVILFGSRARGDYRRTSDIDLAVSGGNRIRFGLDVDEETSTLLEYDVVDLDGPVQAELRKSIESEGKVLYEKI